MRLFHVASFPNAVQPCCLHEACTWGAVAPVHQFVLPLYDGAELCRPVAVLLLVHEEVDALPHQVLLRPAQHVLVAQQHLQHRRESVGRSCVEEGRREGCEAVKHAPQQVMACREATCQAHGHNPEHTGTNIHKAGLRLLHFPNYSPLYILDSFVLTYCGEEAQLTKVIRLNLMTPENQNSCQVCKQWHTGGLLKNTLETQKIIAKC